MAGSPRQIWRARYLALAALLAPIIGLGVVAIVASGAQASLSADSAALARIDLPFGAGKLEKVTVVGGPHASPIPIELRGDQIWPTGRIPVHRLVTIEAVVKRPGWISWLAGDTQRIHLTLTTPSASLRSHYITLRNGRPLVLSFKRPVRVIEYGTVGHLRRHLLSTPQAKIPIGTSGPAGTLSVAAAPMAWELPKPTLVSWFPAGASATAVAVPAPGSSILPHTKITLTFSKPINKALGTDRPPVSPITQGTWHQTTSHTIVFEPEGYGYGLGATVGIGLPAGVSLVGGQSNGTAVAGTWTVPGGSPLRLQQMLSLLGYLPLNFKYAGTGVQPTPEAELQAAVQPPKGKFSWRWKNAPDTLKAFWGPGQMGVMTHAALMSFENDHGLVTDGIAGPTVWKDLIAATIAGKRSTFGYTYVSVSKETSPESLNVWHNGKTVVTAAVNTGIASAPTASGTYPVYEHIPVGTMSGTNPDGSHYHDPGIQWISYFNGGDALHAFTRAQYGFPQSLGCVEMALASAGQVWPFTPIGTLVHVA